MPLILLCFGVFDEGRFLKASTFASGIEILSFVHMTPKNLIMGLAMLIFEGLILILPFSSLPSTLEMTSMCSSNVPLVAIMMSSGSG